MQLRQLRALPVGDGDGYQVGLVQSHTLVARYLNQIQSSEEIDI